MLHTKFRGNRPAGSGEEDFLRVFTIYGHGGQLGHVTSIMSSDFYFLVMHQSFVAPVPLGPRKSGAFNFSIFKALLKALHCRAKFVVKSPLKAPAPGG